jgi:hypothetical protein
MQGWQDILRRRTLLDLGPIDHMQLSRLVFWAPELIGWQQPSDTTLK